MSKYRCRCKHCRARRTMGKHPFDYVRSVRCRSCGRADSMAVDTYRQTGRERHHAPPCHCNGSLHYPHRRGSAGCAHYVEVIPWDFDDTDSYAGDDPPF